MIRLPLLFALLLSLISPLSVAATLSASVDRLQIAADETLTLTLKIDSQSVPGQPDLSLLEPYFDVLDNSKSTQLRIINGQREASTQWQITLSPKLEGRILVPPFEIEGARSEPLQIEVRPASSAPSGSTASYFAELVVADGPIYVGQQLNVRVRLHTAVTLAELEAAPLQLDGVEIVVLDEQRYQKQHNGRRYRVYELNYALFPQAAGMLEIPKQRFSALKNPPRSVFDSLRGERIRLTTGSARIEVLPPPHNQRYWLPATSLKLSQNLSQPNNGYRVGEPISRSLTLSAEGLEATTLPPIRPDSGSAFKSYPEPAELDQQTPAQGVFSSRTENFALVPTQAGKLQLPAVEIPWWDVSAGVWRTARIDAVSLTVQPALNAQPQRPPVAESSPSAPTTAPTTVTPIPEPQSEPKQESAWLLWSNLIWGVICLTLAGLWWRARSQSTPRSTPPQSNEGQQPDDDGAFNDLQQACQSGGLDAVRQALSQWRFNTPELADNPELLRQLEQLDQALYSRESGLQFDADELLATIQALRAQSRQSQAQSPGLAPLYPNRSA